MSDYKVKENTEFIDILNQLGWSVDQKIADRAYNLMMEYFDYDDYDLGLGEDEELKFKNQILGIMQRQKNEEFKI